jgi:sugar/nucleoside kinase (ribokinase family)
VSEHHLDYLVIGHVTRDRAPEGRFTVGGTVTYAARTAQALGCRVGVITSAGEGLDLAEALPDVETLRVPASATTTFDNRYSPTGRVQTIHAVAAPLTPEVVPPTWRMARVVHLGPVARECDPALADLFPNTFVGLTPQGWMRRWDSTGRVRRAPWENADALLPRADAVVLSEEDVGGDETLVARWATHTRALALTRGAAGCTVYAASVRQELPAPRVIEVDPTGAGDVFAAVFFTRLQQGDDPWKAARLANCIAALSVTRPGLSGTPTPEEVARCRARCA